MSQRSLHIPQMGNNVLSNDFVMANLTASALSAPSMTTRILRALFITGRDKVMEEGDF